MKIILDKKDRRKIKKYWVKETRQFLSKIDFECGDIITLTMKITPSLDFGIEAFNGKFIKKEE